MGQTPACNCECHNLTDQLKKSAPVVDVPLLYSEARKGFTRDKSFEDRANAYFTNEGAQLKTYLRGEGRAFYQLEAIGTRGLERGIAAVTMQGDKAMLIGSSDFENKVSELAQHCGVSQNVARRYVFDHETVHLSQKGKCFDDHFAAEYDVEGTLLKYYGELAGKEPKNADYKALAGIAKERSASVPTNYAHTAASKN
jgi:hypothetical protein